MKAASRLSGAILAASVITSAAVTVLPGPARATVWIVKNDTGGLMGDYQRRFQLIQSRGDRVVIDGTCASACTMLLTALPRNLVCATSSAVFGLHQAWDKGKNYDKTHERVLNVEATKVLEGFYPPQLLAALARHGGYKKDFNLTNISGSELRGAIARCPSNWRTPGVISCEGEAFQILPYIPDKGELLPPSMDSGTVKTRPAPGLAPRVPSPRKTRKSPHSAMIFPASLIPMRLGA